MITSPTLKVKQLAPHKIAVSCGRMDVVVNDETNVVFYPSLNTVTPQQAHDLARALTHAVDLLTRSVE